MVKNYLGMDYGAGSGRGMLGSFDGKKLELREVNRFLNNPMPDGTGGLRWDMDRLYGAVKESLLLLKKENLIFIPVSKLITFLSGRKLIHNKEHLLMKLEKIRHDYKECSDLISGHKGVLVTAFIWNLLQRTSQIIVPMLVFAALGGDRSLMPTVFSKQCLITIGYNFVPIPGAMGVSDYLMIDGFNSIMDRASAFSVELISRGMTFYVCVLLSGIITLIGYFAGRKKGR